MTNEQGVECGGQLLTFLEGVKGGGMGVGVGLSLESVYSALNFLIFFPSTRTCKHGNILSKVVKTHPAVFLFTFYI